MNQGYFFSFNKMSYFKGEKPDGCILCLIRDKDPKLADLTVFRDDLFMISVNLYPYNPGHLLVYPVRHLEDVREYSPQEEKRVNGLIRIFLNILDSLYSPSGYNMGYNMGLTSGASIEHLHYHVIPRYPRELGVAELIGGKKVLVEDPRLTVKRLKTKVSENQTLVRMQKNRS